MLSNMEKAVKEKDGHLGKILEDQLHFMTLKQEHLETF